MKLSELKSILQHSSHISFELPDGKLVPSHFHITEVGRVDKHFIDCGGTIRTEKKISLQLWEANDYDHRLQPEKLLNILKLSEEKLSITDGEIEVEYQGDTIGKYHLEFNGERFHLVSTYTDCLAKDNCGIPAEKTKVALSELNASETVTCCGSNSSCC